MIEKKNRKAFLFLRVQFLGEFIWMIKWLIIDKNIFWGKRGMENFTRY